MLQKAAAAARSLTPHAEPAPLPQHLLQIECLMTDQSKLPFARVPELMRALGAALQNEIMAQKPDMVFALTENKGLPALLEHVAPKLAMQMMGRPSPVYRLSYSGDETHLYREPLGLTVMATNSEYDLSFLAKFESTRRAQAGR